MKKRNYFTVYNGANNNNVINVGPGIKEVTKNFESNNKSRQGTNNDTKLNLITFESLLTDTNNIIGNGKNQAKEYNNGPV